MRVLGCTFIQPSLAVFDTQAGIGRIQSNLQTMAKKRRIPEAAAKAAAGRLRGTLSYDSFDSVDLVIEAAIEVSPRLTTSLIAVDRSVHCRSHFLAGSGWAYEVGGL
jgi:predicted ATP-grasp superfamily ATP-dependent carboligase